MALTQTEKRILRKANQGKSDTELDAIGASDDLAREVIEAYKVQRVSFLPAQIDALKRSRDSIQDQIDTLENELTLLEE